MNSASFRILAYLASALIVAFGIRVFRGARRGRRGGGGGGGGALASRGGGGDELAEWQAVDARPDVSRPAVSGGGFGGGGSRVRPVQ